MMATVGSYETKSGRRWRVRYRTPDRRQTDKRGFIAKRDAREFAAVIEVQKATGDFVSASAGRITVGELAPAWMDKKKHSTAPSHYRTLESALRTHVRSDWDARQVADVTTLEVEAWISHLVRQGYGSTTVRRAHSVLAGILTDAVKSRCLVANAAVGVNNLPRRTPRRHVYLTASDVHALAAQAGSDRALVLVLAFCGLRWGEAIALRVADVDFLRRRITVSTNAVQLGGEHHVGPTKDRKCRSVPVPKFIVEDLCRLSDGKSRDDLVFPSPDGGYLPRPRSGDGWFSAALRRAELPAITVHDLRHTCASLAEVRGIAFDASLGVVGDRELVRAFGFGAGAGAAWRYGRHAI